MLKLTLALLLFASAVTYEPAAFRAMLQPELQSIGWQLRSIFDIDRILPGLSRSRHG